MALSGFVFLKILSNFVKLNLTIFLSFFCLAKFIYLLLVFSENSYSNSQLPNQ